MRTNRLFMALAFALVLGGSNVFAQGNEPQDKKSPAPEQCKRPTPEQMMDSQVKRMAKELLLDDATEAKFMSLYKEYLEALMGDKKMDKGDKKECGEKEEPVELSDSEIIKAIEANFERQQKALDTKKKYFESFKKILNAQQLEKVFAPRPQNFKGQPHPMKKNGKKDEAPHGMPQPQQQPGGQCGSCMPPQD